VTKNTVPNIEDLTALEYSLPPGEVIIGELVQISALGEPLVNFTLNSSVHPLVSISTIAVTQKQIGRKVVLMFNEGDLSKPIIIGFVHSPLQEMIESFELTTTVSNPGQEASSEPQENTLDLSKSTTVVDGKKVEIEAQEEIVLKCGEASITLTKAGKIMIRGKYLLNRSTGVNRILGGSVQVN
jgi:tRNA A37 threonylcarbamoyladenosine synthetase subunit TsaC/SUA5/YrdC